MDTSRDRVQTDPTQAFLERLKPDITEMFQKYGMEGGSIGVWKDGTANYLHIGNTDNHEPGVAGDQNTMYLISSITKPYIGTAVGVLITEARARVYGSQYTNLCFDTQVGEVIPELEEKLKDGKGTPYTIGNLLDHRVKVFRSDRLWEDAKGEMLIQPAKQWIDLYAKLPLNSEHDDKEEKGWKDVRNYTNTSFCLAAAVIERVAKTHWWAYLREKVFPEVGMAHSTANLRDQPRLQEFVAPGYSVVPEEFTEVKDIMENLEAVAKGDWGLNSTRITRSKVSHHGSIIAAASGLLSSTKDQLLFLEKWLGIWNDPHKPESRDPLVERGIHVTQEYMRKKMDDPHYTYMCGWNRIDLPYNDAEHRALGTEGDNTKRMVGVWDTVGKAFKTKGTGKNAIPNSLKKNSKLNKLKELYKKNPQLFESTKNMEFAKHFWPFFIDDIDPNRDGKPPVLFYHCGNMVGATSIAIIIPSIEAAIFVASNSRGYFHECASWTGMSVADLLFYRRDDALFKAKVTDLFEDIPMFGAAHYLVTAQQCDENVRGLGLQPIVRGGPDQLVAERCVGKFVLTEPGRDDWDVSPGIFVNIGWDADDNKLYFQQGDGGHRYELKKVTAQPYEGKLRLNWSMPIERWNHEDHGLGGPLRLSPRAFDVVFENPEARSGPFERLFWDFNCVTDRDGHVLAKHMPQGAEEDMWLESWWWKRSS